MTSGRSHYPHRASLSGLENLYTPIWIFDVDRHAMWWANARALEFWKAGSLEDLLARDFASDSKTVRMRLRQIVDARADAPRIVENWTLYPAGEPRTVRLAFRPVLIGDRRDAILFEIAGLRDRGLDDEALRMLEAARATSIMVSTYAMDGRLLVQNPAAFADFDAGAEGAAGLNARLTDPDLPGAILARIASGENFEGEAEVRTREGPRRHWLSGRRGRDPVTGKFVAVISEEDTSEQAALRAELQRLNRQLEARIGENARALRQSEERHALAAETAAIWDWDIEADEFVLPRRLLERLGFGPDEHPGPFSLAEIREMILPEDRAAWDAEAARHRAQPDTPFYLEHRFVTRSGEGRWFRAQGRAVAAGDGQARRSVGLLTDITERKALEASLLEAQRMEAIGQLTGGIAHDFNNLLTVIMGNAELLEMAEGVDRDLVKDILEAGARGAELTQQLLAFSRRQVLQPRVLVVDELIDGMEAMLARVLGSRVRITASADIGLWPVFADPAQVETAVLKIAINARDAMPQGGALRIRCRNAVVRAGQLAQHAEIEPGDYVTLSMADTGRGMKEGTLARAFEPFFSTKGTGSGLGLSMVYGFARQSGGGVTIESSPDRGTAVTIYLPRHLGTEGAD